ncbi:hypothetical protein [Arthrobacter sp. NA-172]|uniref:hypothetical protein n=1 Tax=Arthrobacter sp. NA-172 TaxID=3367524 RepID=UPI0037543CCF
MSLAQCGWNPGRQPLLGVGQSADVLTAQFHVTRASVIVDRCYKGELHMVADRRGLPLVSVTDPTYSSAYQYLYQTAAFVKVAVHPEC